MKQQTVLIVFLLCLAGATFAQSAIVPVGGDAQSNSGSVSYTVGQIAVQTPANGDGSVSVAEGVQQPYEIQAVGVDNYPQIALNAVVYPNPTDNLAHLQLNIWCFRRHLLLLAAAGAASGHCLSSTRSQPLQWGRGGGHASHG